jgi:hypothetical protein
MQVNSQYYPAHVHNTGYFAYPAPTPYQQHQHQHQHQHQDQHQHQYHQHEHSSYPQDEQYSARSQVYTDEPVAALIEEQLQPLQLQQCQRQLHFQLSGTTVQQMNELMALSAATAAVAPQTLEGEMELLRVSGEDDF